METLPTPNALPLFGDDAMQKHLEDAGVSVGNRVNDTTNLMHVELPQDFKLVTILEITFEQHLYVLLDAANESVAGVSWKLEKHRFRKGTIECRMVTTGTDEFKCTFVDGLYKFKEGKRNLHKCESGVHELTCC